MPSPTDDTGPQQAVPPEPDTEPALPAARVRCYDCQGEGMTLQIVERNPDGSVAKALASQCMTCRGAPDGPSLGTVSRAQWRRWYATRRGRPG